MPRATSNPSIEQTSTSGLRPLAAAAHVNVSGTQMKKLAFCGLCLLSSLAHAECWKVADLRGYSVRAGDGYVISPDGYSGQAFEISIYGDVGSVKPLLFPSRASNIKCKVTSELSVICTDGQPPQLTVETWTVSPETGKVFHTKAVVGRGPLDGANLFLGSVLGKC